MQLGLVGLGRMGGNMRDRLRAAGHEVVGFDHKPEISDAEDAGRPGREAARRRARSGSWCRPASPRPRSTSSATHLSPGDIIIDGGNSRFSNDAAAGRAARPAGHRLRRRRRLRRHLGQRTRLRADGRRRRRARRPAHADLRGAQAGGRVRLRARRPGRRRALRQDGPQRHRVRPDARLRRGLRAARRLGAGDQRARRRSSPGARARSSSPGCSTCSTGRSTRTRTWPAIKRLRRRHRRGPLDGRRGDPAGGADERHRGVAVRPLRVPPGRLAGDEGGRRAAQPVRWPRRPQDADRCTSSRLELVDFRSYERVAVDLPAGASVLVGPNGVGKTNLVEALGYVATLDSHRVATDAPLVRAGAAAAVIRCAGRARRTRAAGRAGDRARQGQPGPAGPLAGPPRPRRARRAAAGAVRAGGPGAGPRRPGRAPALPRRPAGRPPAPVRRRAGRLRAGRQAAQRAAAHAPTWPARPAAPRGGDLSTLDVWDTHLAQHGAELLAGRLELVAALAPLVAKAYDAVAAGRGAAGIAYRSSVEIADRWPTGPTLETGAAGRAGRRPAVRESSAASPWSARTATT